MKKILAGVVGLAVLAVAAIGFTQVVSSDRWRTNLWLLDDKAVQLGNLPDAALEYDTVQTPDTLLLGVPATSKTLLVVDKADMATDFAAAAATTPTLRIQNSDQTDPTKYIALSHDGTNAVVKTGKGVVSFPEGISYSNHSGQMAFTAGAAVTAGAWSIGRDADTPNQIHLNVPTGAGFEFSINDVAEYVLNATDADFKGNNFVTTGTVGGGAATFTSGSFSDGNVTNVGDIALDSISTDNTNGLITLKGVGGAANNEDLTFNFEAVANTVGVSTSTGVTLVDFGAIGLAAGNADLSDGDLLNVGNIQLDSLEADAAAGTIVMKGATAGANKEDLVWDFETVANTVGVSSTTGVTLIDVGTIGLAAGNGDFSDGNITNVGDISLDSISSDNATGLIKLAGAGGANNEDLTFDFETAANTVGVSSSTGVTLVDLGVIAFGANGADFSDADITNVGAIHLDSVLSDAAAGTVTIGGHGGAANNEDLIFDFETTADTVGVSSSTGVTEIDFGGLNLDTTGTIEGGAITGTSLDATDGNITNVGSIAVDSVIADGASVDYMDVNIFELTQMDAPANCSVGQIIIDTGGATTELCYCTAIDTWRCTAMGAGPAD